MTDTTAREAASTAFYNDEGTTVSGLKAAFDAYETALVKMIADIRDEAPKRRLRQRRWPRRLGNGLQGNHQTHSSRLKPHPSQ